MAASATNMKTKKHLGSGLKAERFSNAGNCIIYDCACACYFLFFHMFRLPKCLNLVYIR